MGNKAREINRTGFTTEWIVISGPYKQEANQKADKQKAVRAAVQNTSTIDFTSNIGGPSSKSLPRQPFSTINDVGAAREDNFIICPPLDVYVTALH